MSKLCVENMRTRRVKRERYTRKKRLVDHIGELAKTNPTIRDPEEFDDKRVFTPKLQHTDKVTSYKNKVAIKNYQVENVGVHLHEFKQGLRVCRIYNQGILEKIFHSLDEEKKGYLNWDQFLESMTIVCSKSMEDKVDSFLKMVDTEGGGGFDFGEIKEICVLTLEDGMDKENPPDVSESSESETESPIKILLRNAPKTDIDILEETAEFQTTNIFRLLNYDIDDEIPVEEFKKGIFEGDEETQKALKQFCCMDND